MFCVIEARKGVTINQVAFWDVTERFTALSLEEVKARNVAREECDTPIFFIIIIIIYSSTKQLILKYSISALKNLNVEFLLEFVQKEDMENLL